MICTRSNGLTAVYRLVFLLLIGQLGIHQIVGDSECKDEFGLLYGGMLYRDCSNDGTVHAKDQDVVKLAVKLLTRRQGSLPVVNGSLTKPAESGIQINSFHKQRLYHTLDGSNPVFLQYISTESGHSQLIKRPHVLGTTYMLSMGALSDHFIVKHRTRKGCSLSLPSNIPARYFSYLHNFTITRLKDKSLEVYSHSWTDSGKSKVEEDVAMEICDVAMETNDVTMKSSWKNYFTIATQNIWNFNEISPSSYIKRMNILGKMIQRSRLDVIAFQEVRLDVTKATSKMSPNQASHLKSFLKDFQYVYQPAMFDSQVPFVRIEEGLAILSRHPIISWDYITLPRNTSDPDDIHQRILLHAELNVKYFGQVHIFTTHLSLSEEARKRSAVVICNYTHHFSGPKFLLGDLNSLPDSPEMQFLRGETVLENTVCLDFSDLWLQSDLYSDNSQSVAVRAGLTFSSLEADPVKRIDYIYATRSSLLKKVNISYRNISLIKPEHGKGPASDHFGLQATVSVNHCSQGSTP